MTQPSASTSRTAASASQAACGVRTERRAAAARGRICARPARGTQAFVIGVLWLLACAAPDAAAAAAVRGEDVRASVELFVNDAACGDVIIVLRDATPWVPIEALRAAGLRVERGTRLRLTAAAGATSGPAGVEYVSLAALADAIAYRFDEQELQLRLTARPDQFLAQLFPIRTGAPADLVRARNSSAFLNYAAFADVDGHGSGTTIATDAGISVRGALIRVGGGRDATGRYFRSSSHLTIDDTARLVRWDIGDSVAPGALAAATRPVLGVSVSRELGIDPYFVRYTPLTLSGSASSPSVAEVYVNGQLVHRERIAPGSFTLSGLPATVGAGQAEVVLRDTFGREQRVSSTFYEPATLLRPGLQEFHYALGLQRDESRLLRYDGVVASASHRVGINDRLTLGGSANVAPRLLSVEPALATRAPLGELDLRVATTRIDRRLGATWLAAWSYRSRWLSGAITTRRATESLRPTALISPMSLPAASAEAASAALPSSDQRASPGSSPSSASVDAAAWSAAAAASAGPSPPSSLLAFFAPPRRQVDAQVGWTIGRGVTMSVGAIEGDDWSARRVRRETVAISVPASRRGSLIGTWGRALASERVGYELSIGWTMQISTRSTVTAAASRRSDGTQLTQLAYQRSLPVGPGIGGRLQVSPDGGDIDGMVQMQGDHGRVELRRDSFGSGSIGAGGGGVGARAAQSVGVSGAIVAAGGHLFATRTIDDAFAVVKVGDVPGVRVYASNQFVGRTNRRGEAVVPNLVSYYGNRLSIVPEDVPITYAVDAQEFAIAPALRGGALVRFEASRVRPVTGRFLIAARLAIEPLVPSYGEAWIDDVMSREVSPLGKRGEFFFERLEPGHHRARVLMDGFEYDCALTVPDRVDSAGRPIDLGEVLCVGPLSQAAIAPSGRGRVRRP